MLTSINIEKVRRLNLYHTNNLNTNGCLYTDGKYIYKILDYELDDKFKELLEQINEKDYSFLTKPVHIIEENGKAVGYSTIDMKQETMYNLINRPLDQKKRDLLKAFDLVEEIADNDMVYYDFHPGNVLVDKDYEELTLCDLDCLRKTENDSDRRDHFLRGFGLLLSYYYNVDGETARVAIMNGGNIKYDEDNLFRDCMNSIGKKDLRKKVKQLEKINDKHYRKYKHDVEEVIKDRINGGYYKFF